MSLINDQPNPENGRTYEQHLATIPGVCIRIIVVTSQSICAPVQQCKAAGEPSRIDGHDGRGGSRGGRGNATWAFASMSDSNTSGISRPTSPVPALPDTARPYRFNWDPASRQPGPESVSGTTTDGRGPDYYNAIPRLGHLNLNSSTATLSLGALPVEWSSSKHGFHGTWNNV